MKLGRTWLSLFVLSLALAAAWSLPRKGRALSADLDIEEESSEQGDEQEKVFPEDKGPNKIDVSKYPEEQQKNYKLFSVRCSKCHTLARPINSKFATPKEWTAYVNKMSKKRRSGVRKKDVPKIAAFLIYDATIRKKELLKERLEKERQADAAAGAEKADPAESDEQ